MRLIAHAHVKGTSSLVVLIERDFGLVFDYRKQKKVREMGYYVLWAGVSQRDGSLFRKTRKGGFSAFRRICNRG
jgi:hypothetical protein